MTVEQPLIMERTPIQRAAGALAGSAFVATTQILTEVPLDLPLYIALVAFAVNIPFQIVIFFTPVRLTIKEVQHLLRETSPRLSRSLWLYWLIHLVSTPFIVIGFAALFWHFAFWLGILFALAAWSAYRIFSDSGNVRSCVTYILLDVV